MSSSSSQGGVGQNQSQSQAQRNAQSQGQGLSLGCHHVSLSCLGTATATGIASPVTPPSLTPYSGISFKVSEWVSERKESYEWNEIEF